MKWDEKSMKDKFTFVPFNTLQKNVTVSSGFHPASNSACKSSHLYGFHRKSCIHLMFHKCSPDHREILSKLHFKMFSITILNVSFTLVNVTWTFDSLFWVLKAIKYRKKKESQGLPINDWIDLNVVHLSLLSNTGCKMTGHLEPWKKEGATYRYRSTRSKVVF